MGKTKISQKQRLKRNETMDDTNQKNNWVVQKMGLSNKQFRSLCSKLFIQDKQGYLSLRNNKFFSFAAISYFWFDPSEEDSESPEDCVRLVRILVQLHNRKFLDDVEAELDITGLEEYQYDPLEDEDSAVPIDAKKALYAIVGNNQRMVLAGVLRIKVLLFYSFYYLINIVSLFLYTYFL
jgi:hypothetical protein